ncbi:ADP-ribosylglycohydrolase family protein [Levilactobacillus brevis]|nr:ADP-ribosylglycohydrolase family protein [Levilactobacillus brevis]
MATHEKFASEAATYQRLFTPRFQQLPATAIRSTGYVVDTLEAAVWIALNHHDLATGILAAKFRE